MAYSGKMSWIYICFSFYLIAYCACERNFKSADRYSGHKVIRVNPETEDQILHLLELQAKHSRARRGQINQFEFWREPTHVGQSVDMRIHPELSRSVLASLQEHGLNARVIMDDISRPLRRQMVEGESFLESYHTYTEIHEWLFEQAQNCGQSCRIVHLGNSTEGRALTLIKISTSSNNPSIYIEAGAHAREWLSPATSVYLIDRLLAGTRGEDEEAQELVNLFTWYIIPVANPDGFQYSWDHDRMWRKNRRINPSSTCDGVDLNRNWNFHFGGPGSSDYPCDETYRGPSGFSEPETKAQSNFIWFKREQIMMCISLHAYGQFLLFPWGFTDEFPEDSSDLLSLGQHALDVLRDVHGKQFQMGFTGDFFYPAAGGVFDWTKGRAGIKYSMAFELMPDFTSEYNFVIPPEFIQPSGQQMFDAIRAMANSL